jgi:hypothetical protein
MAIPPLRGQFAHREELAPSPHDAGEHDLDERIRPPNGRDNPNFDAGTGRREHYALLRAQLFKKCSF